MSDIDLDTKSRLDVSTGPYDEVVAFTELIINNTFQGIYEAYEKDMKHVSFVAEDSATVCVDILAPKIIIPGNDDQAYGKQVFYMIRFETGWIRTVMDVEANVDGWELAIPTYLNTEDIEPDKAVYEKVQVNETTEKACSVAGVIYKYPGDYTAQRLFAQLLTARWDEPDPELSIITDGNGKKMTLKEFTENDDGLKIWITLAAGLKYWAVKEHQEKRSTINVTFHLRKEDVNKKKPTYAPTYLYQQTYPYRSDETGISKPRTSRTGEGYNSLLWCEMVDNHQPPGIKQLDWNGNHVIPERASGPSIDGSFALSYQHFLENHLLKRLQRLNQISRVTELRQKRDYDRSTGLFVTEWNYKLGEAGFKETDDEYKFNRVETKDGEVSYENNKKVTAPDETYHWKDHGTTCSVTKHESNTHVSVTWENGKNVFKLKGTTDYSYNNTVYPNFEHVDAQKYSQLKYRYKMKWELHLALVGIANGQIQFQLSVPDPDNKAPANLTVLPVENDMYIYKAQIPTEQLEEIRSSWQTLMTNCLKDIETELTGSFEAGLKFVYPGNGHLVFKDPVISRLGNILATIEHKAITSEELRKNDFITVKPALRIPPKAPKDYQPHTHTHKDGTKGPVAKLTWTFTPNRFVAKQTGVEFLLVGKNDTKESVGFFSIVTRFTSGSEGPQLFMNNAINKTPGSLYKKPLASGSTKKPEEPESDILPNAGRIVQSVSNPATIQTGGMDILSLSKSVKDTRWWKVITQRPKSGAGFVVAPGESITYTMTMDVGFAAGHIITIQENWVKLSDLKSFPSPPSSLDFVIPVQVEAFR